MFLFYEYIILHKLTLRALIRGQCIGYGAPLLFFVFLRTSTIPERGGRVNVFVDRLVLSVEFALLLLYKFVIIYKTVIHEE